MEMNAAEHQIISTKADSREPTEEELNKMTESREDCGSTLRSVGFLSSLWFHTLHFWSGGFGF